MKFFAIAMFVASSVLTFAYVTEKLNSETKTHVTGPVFQPIKPVSRLPSNAKSLSSEKLEIIELTDKNTVIMDQVFSDNSVSEVMIKIQKLSENMKANETIYLVMNTPGGSVDAGLRMLSFIKALPQKVKTLTLFSASMGFQTVQQLDERLILDTGTLMSHRATFGCQGEAEGEIESCMNWVMSMVHDLDQKAAARMQMSTQDYKELIRDEYWAYGDKAVTDKAADRKVLAKCGSSLMGSRNVVFDTMFGSFDVEMSRCPLIPGFLSVKAQGNVKPEDKSKAMEYIRMLLANKKQFVNKYIVTNEWKKFEK